MWVMNDGFRDIIGCNFVEYCIYFVFIFIVIELLFIWWFLIFWKFNENFLFIGRLLMEMELFKLMLVVVLEE